MTISAPVAGFLIGVPVGFAAVMKCGNRASPSQYRYGVAVWMAAGMLPWVAINYGMSPDHPRYADVVQLSGAWVACILGYSVGALGATIYKYWRDGNGGRGWDDDPEPGPFEPDPGGLELTMSDFHSECLRNPAPVDVTMITGRG
jgi:hypothetical protein